MNNYFPHIIHDSTLHYLVYFVAGMNVLFMLSVHNYKSVGVFLFVAGCLLVYRKNIILTLLVAMLICNIYYFFSSHIKQRDGFKKKKVKKKIKKKVERVVDGEGEDADGSGGSGGSDGSDGGGGSGQSGSGVDQTIKQNIDAIMRDMVIVRKQLTTV